MREFFHVRTLLLLWTSVAIISDVVAADGSLDSIERRLEKEPEYESAPRYLLLALGAKADTLVWVVEDGRRLYVDTNANGDLTDDGPAIAPSDIRDWRRNANSDARSWDFDYVLTEFTPPGSRTHTDFRLRRWNYDNSTEDSYGLSLTLDGAVPMYAGWVPFWASSPDKASIIHFGGQLTPQMLRYPEFILGSGSRRLSVAFINLGFGEGAKSMLSIDAPTADVIPTLRIRWPAKSGDSPLETTHGLNQRCCYWEFYTTEFEVPAGASVGTAIVTLELPEGALPLPLTTSTMRVPVVARGADSTSTE